MDEEKSFSSCWELENIFFFKVIFYLGFWLYFAMTQVDGSKQLLKRLQ